MNSIDNYSQFIGNLTKFEKELQSLEKGVWADLQNFVANYQKAIQITQNEGRKLKIGIIGQIKAGKSTFLNELLFNGESVLPEASTPMTAALTEITYGEGFSAELIYYDLDEWKKLLELADKVCGQLQKKRNELRNAQQTAPAQHTIDLNECSDEQLFASLSSAFGVAEKAAYELVTTASSQQGLENLLGKRQVFTYDSLSELQAAMKDFVGVGGAKTPFVKACRLMLNLKALEEIDLVDTPGMNDPIISRGLKTREYLTECDAVFLLSGIGQFLDMTDLDLLRCYLPGEGISEITLIASKFDSGLVQESRRFEGDIYKTRSHIETIMAVETTRKIDEALQTVKNNSESILHRLKGQKPILASSYCSKFARLMRSAEEKQLENIHFFKQMKRSFQSTHFDVETLESLSGMGLVLKQLEQVKAKKESVFRQRRADLDREKTTQFDTFVKKLYGSVYNYLNIVENGDLTKIREQMNTLSLSMKKCQANIDMIFDDELTTIKIEINKLIREINNKRDQAKGITIEKRSETYRTEKSGLWNGCKRFFGSDSGYETNTRHYDTADAYEAANKLTSLASLARNAIEEEVEDIFNDGFKKSLKLSLIKVITEKINFDRDNDLILSPLRRAVNTLAITQFRFNSEKYSKMIEASFSGEVTGGEVHKLKKTLSNAVDAMIIEIEEELSKKSEEMLVSLRDAGEKFSENVTSQIDENLKILTIQLSDRANSVERYKNILEALSIPVYH
jgi:hypothetical protein